MLKVFFTLFYLIFHLAVYGETIVVCTSCPVKSIKEGIRVAKPGDVVLVKKGLYRESGIVINKALTIKGEGRPVVDGSNKTEEIFIISAGSVTLEGFTIQNVAASYIKDLAAIRVKRQKKFVIRNNNLFNTVFGIFLEYSDSGLVSNNTLKGNAQKEASSGNGVHAWYCNHLLIQNNRVSGHRDGIYFEFVGQSKIENNVCSDNLRYGLHFMFSNFDEYRHNEFRSNGAGVAVMFSKEIKMLGNTFVENWGSASYGLLLKEIYDAEIRNNIFKENTIGIRVEGSTRVNYFSNDFQNNGWAVKLGGGCYDNHISNNNFMSNSFDMSLERASNNNTIKNNYWSDYSGYDLDKDGTGDVPHRPVKLFNFIVGKTPESMILLRSLFIDLINFSEKVSPVFTPENVTDDFPVMNQISRVY